MIKISKKLSKHLYIVVLCGGGGTRLWPLSRHKTPKQFIELLGSETLYEKTFKRIDDLVPPERIFIITNHEYYDMVRKLSPKVPAKNIIKEPERKNTALAMGVASAYIHKVDKNAVVINLASDQLINNDILFRKTMIAAAEIAGKQKNFVTVGIKPAFPHTGLGYIHAGKHITLSNGFQVLEVSGFREKPDKATAREYLATGKYFWNANLYTWSTKLILSQFKTYSPKIYKSIEAIMNGIGTSQEQSILQKEYAKSPEEQIDTAISEKTSKLYVIPGDFGWVDIGSWNVVHDEAPKDNLSNAFISRGKGANWIPIDTEQTLVNSDKKMVVTIGVDNLMIVETEDALLISRKDRAQDVKMAIKQLEKDHKDLL